LVRFLDPLAHRGERDGGSMASNAAVMENSDEVGEMNSAVCGCSTLSMGTLFVFLSAALKERSQVK